MQTKDRLLTYIKKAKQIIIPLNLNSETQKEQIALLDKFAYNINHLELIIPVVGGFSTGKSTLINHFLGRANLLPTGQEPVTKLATELRYSSGEEYAELIKLDDNDQDKIIKTIRVKIEELSQFVAESGNKKDELEYSYIRLYINNPKLKELEPFILADMPGFNSSNNRHSKAIDLYIRRGVYFLVLQAVAEGEINNSVINELKKIQDSKKEFAFCLTKTDLRPEDFIEEVVESISETLSNELDYDREIYTSNRHNPHALKTMLENISKNELIENVFADELISLGYQTIEKVKANIDILEEDADNIKRAREKLERQKERLEERQEREMNNLENKRFDGVTPIVERVKTELRSNKSSLLRTLERDQEKFSEEVGTLIQTALSSSVKNYLENLSSELTEDFAGILNEIMGNNANQMGLTSDSLARLKADINAKMNKTLLDIRNIDTSVKHENGNDTVGTILKMVMSLLIDNPISKAIISLLPSVLTNLFGSSDDEAEKHIQEMKKQDALNDAFENIISKIAIAVKEQLPKTLNTFKRELMVQIKTIFDKEIQNKLQEIDRAVQEKGNVKDKKAEILKFRESISALQQIINQYLKKQ